MSIKIVKTINQYFSKEEFFYEFMVNESPVVIRNGCKNWPAYKKWSLEYFESIGEKIEVGVSQYKQSGNQRPEERMTYNLSGLMRYYRNPIVNESLSVEDTYLAGWHYLKDLPELMEDIRIPPLFEDNLLTKIDDEVFNYDWSSVFIGNPGTETPCHTDSFYVSVWLALLKGRKVIRYVSSRHHNDIYNGIDLFDPKVEKSLNKKGIVIYHTELRSGDISYHPPGWWHQVKNMEFSIAVSNNYIDKLNYFPFEQQLVSKTIVPILMRLSKFRKDVGVIDALKQLPIEKVSNIQTIETSNFKENQDLINQVIANYINYFKELNKVI